MPSVGSPVPSTAGWSCAGCAPWPCAWIATPKTPPGWRGRWSSTRGGPACSTPGSPPPASMTHASLVGSPLAVDEGLLRLSVGIEHADDLIEDLRQALET